MYLASDLCFGYQYLSLGHIQISPIVVSHTMHSSFKYDSTLLSRTSFLQLVCFCMGYHIFLQENRDSLIALWNQSYN